mgnify:CR=1 FL=1
MIILVIGGLLIPQNSYGAQRPPHKEQKATRGASPLRVLRIEPSLGACHFALTAVSLHPLLRPVYCWTLLNGTGEFSGDVCHTEYERATFSPKDFNPNNIKLEDLANHQAAETTLTLNQCLVGIKPGGDEVVPASMPLELQATGLCPTGGKAFKWTIRNGASSVLGEVLASAMTFQEAVPDTYVVTVQYGISSKTCDSNPKQITVGMVESLTWRDQYFDKPRQISNKKELIFTITFSQPVATVKNALDLKIVTEDRGVMAEPIRDDAAELSNTKVYKVTPNNTTGFPQRIFAQVFINSIYAKQQSLSIQISPFE